MTFKYLTGGAAVCLLMACQAEAPKSETVTETPVQETATVPTLETEWVLHEFDAPESLIPGTTPGTFYVSNVNGEGAAKDGNGYISIITDAGEWVEKDWVSGLNGPKGMALMGGDLYVSDIDEVVRVNTETGEIVSKTPIEGAKFLNDVAAVSNSVFVSDSGSARIHTIIDGEVAIFLEDDRLGGVNGLHPMGDQMLITTMSDGHLLRFNLKTADLTVIASGMKNADGIAVLPGGEFIISSWPGELHHVRNGETTVILDTQEEPVFMNDIFMDERGLFAPNWQPGTVRKMNVVLPAG